VVYDDQQAFVCMLNNLQDLDMQAATVQVGPGYYKVYFLAQ
jgi:hypothetical protein